MHQCLTHKHIQRANEAPKRGNSPISPTHMVPEQALTWGVLGSGKWGHGVGEVEVCSDAELALHRWRIRRGGGQERFFTGFLINSRQIRVNQGIKELHYELSIVWDLGLLWEMGGKEIVLSFVLSCQFELCSRVHSQVTLFCLQIFKSIWCICKNWFVALSGPI